LKNKPLKIAVVSDLHFQPKSQVGNSNKSSWLTFESEKFENQFWSQLLDTIKEENIEADLLICPGDITTHGNEEGLVFAWKKLNELGTLLNSKVLGVATGNHDVQSRPLSINNEIRDLNHVNDLSEALKNLEPEYPIVVQDESVNIAHQRRVHYFGTDFIIYDESDDYRLVIFNSCSRHTSCPSDYERGVISESTVSWLEKALKEMYNAKNKKINIFLCHHHPIQHDDHNLGSYDFIKGGTRLLDMLNKYGSWIVVHGHKHHAKVSYHNTGSKKSVVFAAGTLSSHKNTLGKDFTNQFYILNIDTFNGKGTPKGTIDTWSWHGNRWAKSKSLKDGVFTGVGFGEVGCIESLAENISDFYGESVMPKSWGDILKEFPNLAYFVPKDFEMLQTHLGDLDIDIRFNSQNEFESIEKRTLSN
jgi:predicted phosphodiesterase